MYNWSFFQLRNDQTDSFFLYMLSLGAFISRQYLVLNIQLLSYTAAYKAFRKRGPKK